MYKHRGFLFKLNRLRFESHQLFPIETGFKLWSFVLLFVCRLLMLSTFTWLLSALRTWCRLCARAMLLRPWS